MLVGNLQNHHFVLHCSLYTFWNFPLSNGHQASWHSHCGIVRQWNCPWETYGILPFCRVTRAIASVRKHLFVRCLCVAFHCLCLELVLTQTSRVFHHLLQTRVSPSLPKRGSIAMLCLQCVYYYSSNQVEKLLLGLMRWALYTVEEI